MIHYYNKLTNNAQIAIIEYLLSRGGELLEKNGHYDFHEDDYDCKVVFPELDFIQYDAYESAFYHNNKEIRHIEGNCGPLILNSREETILKNDKRAYTAYVLLREVQFMKAKFRQEI